MPVVTEDIHSESLVQFSTPDKASAEFGILLDEIVKELKKKKASNLRKLKTVSSTLTVQKASKVHVFTDGQLEEIKACDSINTLLVYKLRHCYRWDDFSMLTVLMSSIDSKTCLSLLKKFEVKINSKMKLQQIYEYCKQTSAKFSAEYHKIIAIVDDKIFSKITQKEYNVLKHFVSEQCGVEDYVMSPVTKIAVSSLILEWYIPVTVVAHMIKIALNNEGNFTKNCFVYLKISSTLIFDHRNIVSTWLYYNMVTGPVKINHVVVQKSPNYLYHNLCSICTSKLQILPQMRNLMENLLKLTESSHIRII